MKRWIVAWLGAPVLGIVNGGARDGLYEEAVGEKAAGVISTGTLLALLAGYMWLLEGRWPCAASVRHWKSELPGQP